MTDHKTKDQSTWTRRGRLDHTLRRLLEQPLIRQLPDEVYVSTNLLKDLLEELNYPTPMRPELPAGGPGTLNQCPPQAPEPQQTPDDLIKQGVYRERTRVLDLIHAHSSSVARVGGCIPDALPAVKAICDALRFLRTDVESGKK